MIVANISLTTSLWRRQVSFSILKIGNAIKATASGKQTELEIESGVLVCRCAHRLTLQTWEEATYNSQRTPSTCSRRGRLPPSDSSNHSCLSKWKQKSKHCLQNKAHTPLVTGVLQAGINVMIVTAENKFSYVWQLPENIGRGQGVCTAQQHLCELISHIADGKPAADWDSRRWPVWLRRTWRRLGGKSMSLQWQPKMIFRKCQMHGRWRTGTSFNVFSNYLLWAPVQLIKQNYMA